MPSFLVFFLLFSSTIIFKYLSSYSTSPVDSDSAEIMSQQEDLTRNICTNLLRVVEQLQSTSSTQSSSSYNLSTPAPQRQADYSAHNQLHQHIRSELGSLESGQSSSASTNHSEALRHLFRSKTKPISPFDRKGKRKKLMATCSDEKVWKHNFFCLSNKDQASVPDGTEKAILKLAGLGEKAVTLVTSKDLTEQLYNEFSQLKDAGGYELLRQGPNRLLELIPIPPQGYTVDYVQSVVPHAKIYIRPIQIDLNTNNEISSGSVRQEECMKCSCLIPLHALKQHVNECSQEKVEFDGVIDLNDEECWQSDSDEVIESEDVSKPPQPKSFSDIVRRLRVLHLSIRNATVAVRRTHFIEDLLQYAHGKDFDPAKRIIVRFSNEPGSDAGGLRRELFTLLESGVKPTYLDSLGCFNHNLCALYENVYFRLGQLVAMSVVQGGLEGSSFAVSPSTYMYISGKSLNEISQTVSISEVSDTLVRDFLSKISHIDNVEDLRKQYAENFSIACENGVTKPYSTICLAEKDDIIKMICLNFIIMKCLAEIQQFCSGLESLEVLEEIRKNPDEFKSFFLRKEELTAETLLKIVGTNVTYSSEEENRQKEECTLAMFSEYLEEVQKGLVCDDGRVLNMGQVLQFFTGSNSLPYEGITGFLNFSHTDKYPRGATCINELTLPAKFVGDYGMFKDNMTKGVLDNGGFGRI